MPRPVPAPSPIPGAPPPRARVESTGLANAPGGSTRSESRRSNAAQAARRARNHAWYGSAYAFPSASMTRSSRREKTRDASMPGRSVPPAPVPPSSRKGSATRPVASSLATSPSGRNSRSRNCSAFAFAYLPPSPSRDSPSPAAEKTHHCPLSSETTTPAPSGAHAPSRTRVSNADPSNTRTKAPSRTSHTHTTPSWPALSTTSGFHGCGCSTCTAPRWRVVARRNVPARGSHARKAKSLIAPTTYRSCAVQIACSI